MASHERWAVLFPGQGSYRAGFLRQLVEKSEEAARAVEEIDQVAVRLQAETLSERIVAADAPKVDVLLDTDPDLLQLAIYGAAVALHAATEQHIAAPVAVMGHSLGEVAALVAGGALTVGQGAEVVIHRSAALRRAARSGGMVSLACDVERAQLVLDLVEEPLAAVAAVNAPQQCVVSGPASALATVAAVSRALGIDAVALTSPYPFHSPVLAPVVADFNRSIAAVTAGPLSTPTYSPTLGRFVRPDDEVPDLLAQALVRRVEFSRGVQRLGRYGATTFWECSGGSILSRLVQRVLPSADVLSGVVTGTPRPSAQPAQPVQQVPPVQRPRAVQPAPPVAATPATSKQPSSASLLAAAPVTKLPSTREAVFDELRTLYAAALEYPEEVFAEDVSLEADLGVDSVKQTELLGRAAEAYEMPERPENFRLSDYDTMGRLVDYVWSARSRSADSPVEAAA